MQGEKRGTVQGDGIGIHAAAEILHIQVLHRWRSGRTHEVTLPYTGGAVILVTRIARSGEIQDARSRYLVHRGGNCPVLEYGLGIVAHVIDHDCTAEICM